MSLDIQLTNPTDPKVTVSLLESKGSIRLFVGSSMILDGTKRSSELSEPIPKENLLNLKNFLNHINLDKYEY